MRRDELKPCPFCGGSPHLMHCGAATYMVQCVQCKATTDDGCLDRISANWNKREPETYEERCYRVLEAIAPPDDGTAQEVLSSALQCANAWVPEARILGNVRAGDLSRALSAALSIEQTQPDGWQHRTKQPGAQWSEWRYGRANFSATWGIIYEDRPLYAHPPTTRIADSAEAGGSATSSKGCAE